MCDFLITHCKGQLGSAVGWLKALRFVSFRLEVPSLKSVLQSEAVRAFGKSVNIVQRRETAPFPLSFVIWLERQVLDASQTAAQRIRCGFLLVCVFASLRWSDAQWSPPSFLHCERQAMLGTAVRTRRPGLRDSWRGPKQPPVGAKSGSAWFKKPWCERRQPNRDSALTFWWQIWAQMSESRFLRLLESIGWGGTHSATLDPLL